jgi:hypothetical protein
MLAHHSVGDFAMKRLSMLGVTMLFSAAACESGSGANPEASAGSIVRVSASAAAVVLNAGASTTLPITVERTPGFARSVELTLSGLPSGVTYSFAPSVLSFGQATSTLTLQSTQGVLAGSYPIVVRAAASAVEPKTTQVNVTVPAPDVSVAFATGSVNVRLEDTVSIPVIVTRTGGGFVDPIALGMSNLPSGMTASFSPSVLTGTNTASVLTLSPAIETTLGARTLQVTTSGISPSTKVTPLPLTVLDAAAPTFRVRVTFPSLTGPVGGGTVESTLGIPRGGGLTSPVTLSAAGLPAGVTAEFAPAVVTGTSSTIRLTATPGATPGIYPITVRGVATGLADRVVPVTYIVSGFRLFSATVTVQRGDSALIPMAIAGYGSLSEPVTVALSRATSGFTFTGLPRSSMTAAGNTTWAAGVTVDASVAPGVYTIDIEARGRSQGISTSTITITVTN